MPAQLFAVVLGLSGSVLALLASTEARAAAFEPQTLRVPGAVQWVTEGDLDGDGRRDLVVSYRRGGGPAAERFIAVFYRKPSGFGTRPSHAFRAPAPAAVFDVGPTGEGGRDELVFWTRTGVFAMSFQGRSAQAPRSVLSAESLVGHPEDQDLPHWDLVREVDGRPLLVLPTAEGVSLYRVRESEWVKVADLPIRPIELYDAETDTFRPGEDGGAPVRNYAFRVTRMVPKLSFIDQTGDGRSDVVSTFEDRVEVFRAREDGSFQPEPVYREWFALRTREEIENRDATLYATIAHLDGDGIADLCLSKSSGGLSSFKSEVRLYRGLQGGGFTRKPVQTFEHGGIGSLVTFVDVDGDGQVEMLEPSAEISLAAMVRALFARSFQVDIRLHRARKEDGVFFEAEAAQELTARFDLDLGASSSIRGGPPLFGDDFDGDGVPDALMSDGGERMSLHKGLRDSERFFRSDAFIHLEGATSGTMVSIRAGPDALPDVVAYYVGRDDLRSQLLVHVNRYSEPERTP